MQLQPPNSTQVNATVAASNGTTLGGNATAAGANATGTGANVTCIGAGCDVGAGGVTGFNGTTRLFIFGYGSLLNWGSTSRTNCGLTGLSEDQIIGMSQLFSIAGLSFATVTEKCTVKGMRAVRVKGLERGWYTYVNNTKMAPASPFPGSAFNSQWTALGVVANETATVNGIIYEVGQAEFNRTVEREARGGYTVQQLPLAAVTLLSGEPLPNGTTVWAFVEPSAARRAPSPTAPIPLSYIDVVVGGAIDVQAKAGLGPGGNYSALSNNIYTSFVEELLQTTYGWQPYIVNDRDNPLRPSGEINHLGDIDDALYAHVKGSVLAGMRFPGHPFPPPTPGVP